MIRPGQRRLIAALLVTTISSGCYKWEAVTGSPAEVIHKRSPKKVRVVLPGDSTVTLHPYVLQGDTLRGMERSSGTTNDHVIALSDVRGIQMRVLDGAATSRAILTGTLAAAAVVLLIVVASTDFCLFEGQCE